MRDRERSILLWYVDCRSRLVEVLDRCVSPKIGAILDATSKKIKSCWSGFISRWGHCWHTI